MTKRCTLHLPLPDFVLGDFNLTEDPIDRAPAHPDNLAAIEIMREVCWAWNIQDTWRHLYPTTRCYTYHANAGGSHIQSRLDRIYTTQETAQHVFDWQIKPSAVPTDHWLVKVRYAPSDAPFIGNGRWTWPLYTLENDTLLDKVGQRGLLFMESVNKLQTEHTDRTISNPQTLWRTYKEDIAKLAKEHTRSTYHKLNSQIEAIEKDLHALNNEPDPAAYTNAAFLRKELEHLTMVKAKNQRNKL